MATHAHEPGPPAQWARLLATRNDALLAALVVALAAVAWVVTASRMDGMDLGPGLMPMGLGFYVVSWTLMMAAMMLPATVPMVLIYEGMRAGRERRGETLPRAATAMLVGGYLVVWAVAGVLAWMVFEAVRDIDALAWGEAGRWVAAVTIGAAALYQLTPLKRACLTHCRSPLMFIAEHWSPGRRGALLIGLRHGLWCLGCCWALMAALFALGVMDLRWMAIVAAAIAAEKLLPSGLVARRGVALGLLGLAIAVAAVPGDVPWLIDDAAAGGAAMESMDTMEP